MDAKNDDSAGSDSLDKSLQKKCVVDDAMGYCVEQTTSTAETATAVATSKGVVDGVSGAGAGEGASAKKLKTDEPGDVVAAASDEATTIKTNTDASCAGTHNTTDKQNSERNSKKMTNTLEAESSNSSCSTASSSNSATNAAASTASSLSPSLAPGSSTGKAFETKVKQISKNLQETTLAAASTKVTLEDTTSSSSTSSSSSSSSSTASSSSSSSSTNSSASNTTEFEPPQTAATVEQEPDDATSLKSLPAAQVSTPNTSVNQSPPLLQDDDMDELDTSEARAKKVRFHPDVKENDGGNRVAKKKKRMKGAVGGASGSAASSGDAHCAATRLDYDVDMDDDEDDAEEEDEFDLAKTIAEAQNYLKEHPLSFVGPNQKLTGGAKLKSGLLEEEDLKLLGSDSSDDEADFYANSKPENGIERIVGKQIRSGIVEFLLRYVDRPGLFWVSEDFVGKQCPTLYNEYELNRERRQQRLMRYVAKRQNLRQRYTDF